MASKTKTDINFYTVGTPNGIKVSILLEELGLDYKTHTISFKDNEQKEPWFLEINPNGRIPAITDVTEDGKQIRVFESGAILQYLVARYDKDYKVSYPYNTPEYWEMTSWGQANHFNRYAPEKIPYGIDRYINETRRLYRTMDTHLAKQPSGYLVGDKCTIADISCWGWVAAAKWTGLDINEFPNLKKWLFKCVERPGFEAGRHVPTKHTALDHFDKTDEELEAEAKKNSAWIMKGMKEDKEK
ncbi:Glutathione S-transferase 2 [Amphichorda felina]